MSESKKLDATVFEKVRRLQSAIERKDFLDEACGDDLAMRHRIEAMLEAADRADAFFSTESDSVPSASPTTIEGPGKQIGRYKLLQQIGEGGFGIVFLAEQQEPVVRRVALKIIKPGMDTKQVIARFESERQALALMDHPHIAKVLDGGTTETGRPYFVMELVNGIPITQFCDDYQYDTQQRLELFQRVCSAVQHAHQKGIIHRDIKPTNILVTLHDLIAVPKVIDFGIAKATQQRLTEKTLFTQFQQFIGTPAYMSPEQASISGLDIDTRSDVYSLGVLLYELLIGTTPFDTKALFSKGYDEIRRVIREDDAPRPSTRLNTLEQSTKTNTAAKRKTNITDLTTLLRGELDWIVMKSLEKDRRQRYESASSLAEDVQRYLADEPVKAVAPSRTYRLKKFARRNRAALATGLAFALVLISTSAVSIWQALKANQANRELGIQLNLTQDAKTLAQANEQAARASQAAAQQNLEALWIERARDDFQRGEPGMGLAWLAYANRTNPTNKVLADGLVSALQNHTYPRRLTKVMRHDGPVNLAVFSQQGDRLISGSEDNTARIWDLESGRQLGESMVHTGRIQALTFSPDQKRIASASRDNTARVWDALSGVPLTPPLQHDHWVQDLAFTPNGNRLITASKDNSVRVWNPNTGELLARLDEHTDQVLSIAVSRDGRYLLTGSVDRTAILWDLETFLPARPPIKHPTGVGAVDISDDGSQLLLAGGGIQVWQADSDTPTTDYLHHPGLTHAEFSPDGTAVLSCSFLDDGAPGKAVIWDIESGRRRVQPIRHPTHPLYGAEFSPNGQQIVTAGYDKTTRIWDAHTGKQIGPSLRQTEAIYQARFSPDGKSIATTSPEGTVTLWDARFLEPGIHRFPRNGTISNFDLSPDGNTLVTGTSASEFQTWNLRSSLTPHHRLKHRPHPRGRRQSDVSPDNQRILTTPGDYAQLWDLATGRPIGAELSHQAPLAFAQFSPSGKFIITGSLDDTSRLWDSKTGVPLTPPMAHPHDVLSFAFNPSEAKVITLPRFHPLQIHDTETGAQIELPIEHPDWVFFALFSPDGSAIITSCMDGYTRVWDAETGELKTDPILNSAGQHTIQFTPVKSNLATMATDFVVRFWDWRSGQAAAPSLYHKTPPSRLRFVQDETRILTRFESDASRLQLWDHVSGLPIGPAFAPGAAQGPTLSPDDRFVLVANAAKCSQYELPNFPLPAPPLLADIAEAIGGFQITPDGRATEYRQQSVSPQEVFQQGFSELQLPAEQSRFLRWLLKDPSSRTLTPSSSLTWDDLRKSLLEANTSSSLRTLLRFDPINGNALAQLAQLTIAKKTAPRSSSIRQARYLASLANRWAPGTFQTQLSNAQVAAVANEPLQALSHVNSAIAIQDADALAWHLKSKILATLDRNEEAIAASHQAVRLANGQDTELLIKLISHRQDLALRLKQELRAEQDQRQLNNLRGIPQRTPAMPAEALDLSLVYNRSLNQSIFEQSQLSLHEFEANRPSQFDNIPFDSRGVILLRQTLKDFTQQVFSAEGPGITVGRKLERIHILHGATDEGRQVPVGTTLATYQLIYEDNTILTLPVEAGKHLRDGQFHDGNPIHLQENNELGLVWSGRNTHGQWERDPNRVGFFKTTWPNPHPNKIVNAIKLVAEHPKTGVFVLAITIE